MATAKMSFTALINITAKHINTKTSPVKTPVAAPHGDRDNVRTEHNG